MTDINKQNIRHKTNMFRLLSEILDDDYLANVLFFKGGTCATMLGYLDRFSVDLDFDLSADADKKRCRKRLYEVFDELGFEIKDESKKALQFFLKYDAPENERNTIKLEIFDKIFKSNDYEPKYLPQIKRTAVCQTIETMFAHKLVAPIDRTESGGAIAGRDIYDIHHFFINSYRYKKAIIEERRRKPVVDHLQELKKLINNKITLNTLDEDINVLLDYDKFIRVRKHIKGEVLAFLEEEIRQGSGENSV